MKKITETCYRDEAKSLSVVKPEKIENWIVLSKQGALLHGPDNRANCFKFVEDYEV